MAVMQSCLSGSAFSDWRLIGRKAIPYRAYFLGLHSATVGAPWMMVVVRYLRAATGPLIFLANVGGLTTFRAPEGKLAHEASQLTYSKYSGVLQNQSTIEDGRCV